MPSEVLANSGALTVDDGDVSLQDETGLGAGAGAVGEVGDPGTIGVGPVGPLFRQNKPKVKNLKTGRQKILIRNVDIDERLVVRSEDCTAAVAMIASANKYSRLWDDIF